MFALPWIIFALAGCILLYLVASSRREAAEAVASSEDTPAAETSNSLARPANSNTSLRERLMHAGFYQEGFLPLLQAARICLLGLIVFSGYLLSFTDAVSLRSGLAIGLLGAGFAALAPGFLLDYLKARR